MIWSKIIIDVLPDEQDLLVADLVEWGATAFEEEEGTLTLWLDENGDRQGLENLLGEWESKRGALTWRVEPVEDQNWNRQWEESIQPLEIGPFFIHPTWSSAAVPDGRIEITIDPKMAFGTGYHETTHLILSWLPDMASGSVENLLDAGTGTGLLAIAALKLGVQHAIGFDIDPWSVRNAQENRVLNDVEAFFEVFEGDEHVIPEGIKFDRVVANINRNVLTDMIPALVARTREGGMLLLSGLLDRDESWMREALEREGQQVAEIRRRGEWIALRIDVVR
ncbi:MAG: 50S ribosomal protein L11 methyltransferase [Balneolaceae bacterium]